VRVAAVTVATILVVFTFAANLPARNLHGATAAEDFAWDILDTVPSGGVLFVESMDAFGVLYLTQVLGERSDVTIYDRAGNLFRNLHEDFPVRKDRGESWLAYRARSEQAFIDRELSRAEPRAVIFRGWPGYEAPPHYRIEPVGLLYRVRPSTDPEQDTTILWSGYRAESVTAQAGRTADPVALSVAATYPMARAERAIFDGDRTSADRLFAEVDRLAPHDAGLHSYVGIVHARHGDVGQAIEWFRRATEIRPSSYKAWNNLAMAYEIIGNLEGAKRALRRSIEVAPGQSDVASSLRRLEQKGTDPVR
jgi:tetratricopeptide (TPR) repeat protein